MTVDLPPLALSVRQPWAWAILHAGKDIENRSSGAIRAGNMKPGRIALHAASAMTQKEYVWAVWRMAQDGVTVPAPTNLTRGAIVGTVTVVEIVDQSDSPWFGGAMGLRLSDPVALKTPIPSKGALGYFRWEKGTDLRPDAAWMTRGRFAKSPTSELFEHLPLMFDTPPERPFAKVKPGRKPRP
jgi:hypothetical protein